MAKRRASDDWQLGMSFDAETGAETVVPIDVPGVAEPDPLDEILAAPSAAPFVFDGVPFGSVGELLAECVPDVDAEVGLATDAAPPEEPDEDLSLNTRVCIVDADAQAPTVMAAGMGDAKLTQTYLGDERTGSHRFDIAGARRLVVPPDKPAPTVMAGGIGSVNTSQYTDGVLRGSAAEDGVKPQYRIPLMREIAAVQSNGLLAVSTFTGCGGSDLGLEMAGYDVLWGNEFIPAAQDTFRANHPRSLLDTRDIRTVTGAEITAALGGREIDLFVGSPPCASFSTAGKGSKGWGQVRSYSDTKQRTDDLFEQYIRLVDELRPRAFVAENVAGMVKGVAVGFFRRYLRKMRTLPYNVEARLLDAQWLGVPQRRVRLIFIGVRKDVGRPAWPRKLAHRYSIREAIPWITSATAKGHSDSDWQKPEDRMNAEAPCPTVPTGDSMGSFYGHNVERVTIQEDDYGEGVGRLRSIDAPGGIGANRADPRDLPRVIYDEGYKGTPPRDVTDAPAPTIKVGAGSLCSTHFIVDGGGPPDADTVLGDKRLQSISDRQCDVVIEGSHGYDGHAPRSVDEPSETITNRTLSVITQRPVETVITDRSGSQFHRIDSSIDEPAVTIKATESMQALLDEQRLHEPSYGVEPQSALGNAVGLEWDKLQPGEQSDKYLSLIRPHPDDVCPTVTQLGGTSAASVTHPLERRKFTIAELRRICGFPDDFVLTGTYSQQWERLGRAVPPPMMRAVGEALVAVLKKDGA